MSHSQADTAVKLRQLRGIVEHRQHGKVLGQRLDLTTAHAIVTVYDALKPENQAKFLALPVYRMAIVAFKLLTRERNRGG